MTLPRAALAHNPFHPVGRHILQAGRDTNHTNQSHNKPAMATGSDDKEERSLIMKTRRLCAVIAAAATLLGGMAFGVAAAQAAGTASIEVRHSQEGHTYAAYKFASLTPDGGTVQVDTDADWVDAVSTAVGAANNEMTPAGIMPSEYDDNPAAFAATKTGTGDEAWFRAFAESMAVGQDVTADGTASGNGAAVTIGSLDEGWYLVTDTDDEGNLGVNAIVATTIGGISGTFTVKGDPATGQGRINAVGAFVAKNENLPDEPGKTADQATTADGVAIGQTITYTITLDIPEAAAGYDSYPYFVRDIASKGLTVNKDFAATIGGAAASFDYVTGPAVGTDGKTTTVLKFELGGKGGQLKITYTAVVNKDIVDSGNHVTNMADVSRNGDDWGPSIEVKSYTGGFAFHKYGVGDDANGLKGAVFAVYAGDRASGTPLRFAKLEDGEYRLAEPNETGENVTSEVVTTTGNVRIMGLKTGDYTLKETGFVDGYAKNFVPTFTVKLKVDQETGDSTFTLGSNNLGLAGVVDKVIQVKNVKSVTQLPLTGAAGTALFTIAALLMAGAGLLVAFRFRDVDSGATAGV